MQAESHSTPSAPLPVACGMQTVDLLHAGWCLQSQDGKHRVPDAALPAQALDLLHRAGLVGDPLAGCEPSQTINTDPHKPFSLGEIPLCHWEVQRFTVGHSFLPGIAHLMVRRVSCRFNDEELKWVAAEVWGFSRQFDVPAEALARTSVELLLTG